MLQHERNLSQCGFPVKRFQCVEKAKMCHLSFKNDITAVLQNQNAQTMTSSELSAFVLSYIFDCSYFSNNL